jgi:6-phosphofructo-2-kinase/fructose-2,6-biphosphatase 2
VLRAILGYFLGTPLDQLPYMRVPLHTLVQLTPRAYGCDVACHAVKIPSVDTHRPSRFIDKVYELPPPIIYGEHEI